MVDGLELATRLVQEICGGEASERQVEGYKPHEPKTISFPYSEVARLGGIEIEPKTSADILTRLGFKVEDHGGTATVSVPSWRPDVEGKADLVEEVLRINGVNAIKPEPLPSFGAVNSRILTTLQIRTRLARRALAVRGMAEALTWSFVSAKEAELFGGGAENLRLSNPIASDMSDMRPSLLPGLLKAVQRNVDRGRADIAMFEVSGTYESDAPKGQRRVASGVRRGTAHMERQGRDWSGNAGPVGVFDAKADALAVLEACGAPADKLQVVAEAPSWYHPGRSGTIRLGPKIILATFGEFHPSTLEALDVDGPLCGFEVFIDAIPEPKQKATRSRGKLEISQLQAVTRDFAFVVDKTVEAATITRAAASADKKLITGVNVFDIFEGASLGEGKKSVAIEVTIQPSDKTLTDEDFEALAGKIVQNVGKQTGGSLRG
jgi:phenylalanyl-tRNA synthetase beta chain